MPTLIDELATVMRPVTEARGLPNRHYVDAAAFAEERRVVLGANWACIGFGKDVPEAGDVMPVDSLGQPLLVTRDQDGAIRVFENVCRHRGMILVDAPKRLSGVIRCPYHSWCYDLDGKLRVTPHAGGPGQNVSVGIDRAQLGLVEVRSAVWMDLIFVNLSGTAPEFEDRVAPLADRWADFAGQTLHHGGPDSSFKLDVKTNWKLAVENYCESYHLPWVHPGLNSYSRLEDHYNIVASRDHAGQGTMVYNPTLAGADGRTFPNFTGIDTQRWEMAAEYVALFPNVLLGIHRDHFYAILLEPVAPDRTVERVEIYYADPEVLADDWAELRAKNAAMWKEIFIEDIFVVEGMQKGRSAPGFDGGKFSPEMDEPTHCFHDWVAAQHVASTPAAVPTAAE